MKIIWVGICTCGHPNIDHGKSDSINYTTKKCKKDYQCKNFIHNYKDDRMNGENMAKISTAPSLEEERVRLMPIIKKLRKEIDTLIQQVGRGYESHIAYHGYTNSLEFDEAKKEVRIHLIDAKMWSGKMLEALGNPFPSELADKAE